MIRLIEKITVTDVQDRDYSMALDLIPASGTCLISEQEDEGGRFERIELSFRTGQPGSLDDWWRRDLILDVTFSDGSAETIGTDSVPARLNTSKSSVFDVSCEYIRPL